MYNFTINSTECKQIKLLLSRYVFLMRLPLLCSHTAATAFSIENAQIRYCWGFILLKMLK